MTTARPRNLMAMADRLQERLERHSVTVGQSDCLDDMAGIKQRVRQR